jgi:hypothetical protein
MVFRGVLKIEVKPTRSGIRNNHTHNVSSYSGNSFVTRNISEHEQRAYIATSSASVLCCTP